MDESCRKGGVIVIRGFSNIIVPSTYIYIYIYTYIKDIYIFNIYKSNRWKHVSIAPWIHDDRRYLFNEQWSGRKRALGCASSSTWISWLILPPLICWTRVTWASASYRIHCEDTWRSTGPPFSSSSCSSPYGRPSTTTPLTRIVWPIKTVSQDEVVDLSRDTRLLFSRREPACHDLCFFPKHCFSQTLRPISF